MNLKIKKLSTCLWFNGLAREAAQFYCSVFPGSSIISENPVVVCFEIMGQAFQGLNGGLNFKFTEAISLVIACESQEEIDYYWDHLVEGGTESRCGWLKDKYGLSWQVVPTVLGSLMADPERANRVTKAFLPMHKLDIQTLLDA